MNGVGIGLSCFFDQSVCKGLTAEISFHGVEDSNDHAFSMLDHPNLRARQTGFQPVPRLRLAGGPLY